MHEANPDIKKKPSYLRVVIRSVISIAAMGIAIFVLAGRLNYWQGWLYFSTFLVLMISFFVFFAKKPDLVQERLKPGPGVKWWDKIFFVFYIPLFISIILIGAVDAGRFHWSPELPIFVYFLMFVLVLISYCLIYWAMWTNQFFSSRVRIQTDRGQYVVSEGPYHYVRHPGYAGAIVLLPATGLLLGSICALIPAVATVVLFIIRTYLEDTMLKKELPGYADYAKKTRFRLIPKIW